MMKPMTQKTPHDNGNNIMKFRMPEGTDELMGFIPFVPNQKMDGKAALIFRRSYMKLSPQALIDLGMPEYVLVMVDCRKKRLAFMPCGESDNNRIRVGAMAGSGVKGIIQAESLRKQVQMMVGKEKIECASCEGHKALTKEPALIFSLNDLTEQAI